MRRSSWVVAPFTVASFAFAAACSSPSSGGDGASSGAALETVASCGAVTPDASKSLFVTDATALAGFPLKAVMSQIAASGSTTGQTGLALYQQMVDTLNDKAHGTTSGPHCDDVLTNGAPSINGFPVECPRQEGALSTTDAFGTGPDGYVPLGLVNRFDLAPASGANCGQYRVVFGKISGKTAFNDRMLVIFEAVLPNPNPSGGIAACLPVAQFWDGLTSDTSATSRASKLKSFYFTGLPGFAPVIAAANYGVGGGTNTGQIRANMFMNARGGQPWELREFRLSRTCAGTSCSLVAHNTFDRTNPFGGLFAGTDTQSTTFQASFLNQVSHLASRDLNTIGMNTPVANNAGESDEQDSSNDYAFQARNNQPFLDQITAKLAALGRTDLTAANVLDRATTQSCAGCHQLSPFDQLGAGLVWPQSNGFTQIDESSRLSLALTNTFLPFRGGVLVKFINAQCGDGGAVTGSGSGDETTIGGALVGAAN